RFLEAWPFLTLVALAWVALMLVVALGADFLSPFHYSAPDLRARLLPPVGLGGTWKHALGTDELGRDVLSRLIISIRISVLIVSMTITFPETILLESGLSFLGLGVQPPLSSLGNMVGYGREYLTRASWILLFPSAVIILTTLSISIIGDWLRDRLDPTLR